MDTPGGGGFPANVRDGGLERFLASAIATILTIIFSWRLLLQDEQQGERDRRSITMNESNATSAVPVSMATQGSDADDEGDDDNASVTSGPMLTPGRLDFASRHGILSSPDTASYYTISSPETLSDAYEDARDVISPVPLHGDATKYYVTRSVRSPILSSPDTEYYSCQSHDENSDDVMMAARPGQPLTTIHYDPIHGMLDASFDRSVLRDSDEDSDATLENNEPEDSSDDSFSNEMDEYLVEGAAIQDSSSESEYGVIYESQLDRITEEESDQLSSSGRSNTDIDSAPEEPQELPLGQSPPRTSMINTARPLIIGPYTDRYSQFSRDNMIHQDGSPGTSPNSNPNRLSFSRDEGSGDDTPVVEHLPDWMRAYPRKSGDDSPEVAADTQRHAVESGRTRSSANQTVSKETSAGIDIVIIDKATAGHESTDTGISDSSMVSSLTPDEEKPMVGTVSKIRQQFESGNVAKAVSGKDIESQNDKGVPNKQEGNYTFTILKPIPAQANKQDKATQKTFKRGPGMGSSESLSADVTTDHSPNVNNTEADRLTQAKTNAIDNTNKSDGTGQSESNNKWNNTTGTLTSGAARPLTSKLTLDLSPACVTSTGSSSKDNAEGQKAGNEGDGGDAKPSQTRGRPITSSIPPWRSIRASTSPAYQDSHLSSPSDVKPPRGFSFVETTGVETEYSIRTKSRYRLDDDTPLVKSKSESHLNFDWSTPPSNDGAGNLDTNRYSWGPEGGFGQTGLSSGSLGNLSLSSGLYNSYSPYKTYNISYGGSRTPPGGSPEHYTSRSPSRSIIISRSSPNVSSGSTSVFRRNIHTQRPAVRRKPLNEIEAEIRASSTTSRSPASHMTLRQGLSGNLSNRPHSVTMPTDANLSGSNASDVRLSRDYQDPQRHVGGARSTSLSTRPLGETDRTMTDVDRTVSGHKNDPLESKKYSPASVGPALQGPLSQSSNKIKPDANNSPDTNAKDADLSSHGAEKLKQQRGDLHSADDLDSHRWATRQGHPIVQGAPYSEYIKQVQGVRGARGVQAAVPRPASSEHYPPENQLPKQTVTASATSTALARRSSRDGLDDVSSEIVSAVGQAEATGYNPYVAVARATARAASLASANATAGVAALPAPVTSSGAHPAEVSVVISTSCRVNADDTQKLQRESKELIESLGHQVQYRVHRPDSDLKAIEAPNMPVTFGETKILNPEDDQGPRIMTIVIQLPGNEAQKVTCDVPVNGNNEADVSAAVSAAVKKILTDVVVGEGSAVQGPQLNRAVDRVTRQVLQAYSSDVSDVDEDSQSSQDTRKGPLTSPRRVNTTREPSRAELVGREKGRNDSGRFSENDPFPRGEKDRRVFYVKGTNPGLLSGAQSEDVLLQVAADKDWQPNIETVVVSETPRSSQNEAGFPGTPGIPGVPRSGAVRGIPATSAASGGQGSKTAAAAAAVGARPALAMQGTSHSGVARQNQSIEADDAMTHRDGRHTASLPSRPATGSAVRQRHGYVLDAVRRYSSPNEDYNSYNNDTGTTGSSTATHATVQASENEDTPKKPIKGILKQGKDVNSNTEVGLARIKHTEPTKTNKTAQRPLSAPIGPVVKNTASPTSPTKPPVPSKPPGLSQGSWGQSSKGQQANAPQTGGTTRSPVEKIEKKPYDSVLLKPVEDKRTPFYITKQLEDPVKDDILNVMEMASKVLDAKNTFYSAKGHLPVMAASTPAIDTYDAEFEKRKQRWNSNKPPIPKNNMMVVDIDIDSSKRNSEDVRRKLSTSEDVKRKLSSARPRAPPPNPQIESAWQEGVLKAARSHDRALNVPPRSRKGSTSSVSASSDCDSNIRKAKSLNTLPSSFFKDRSSYTSLLETDLDTLEHTQTPLVTETNLDDALGPKAKSMSNLNSPAKWLGKHYVPDDKHHSMDMLNAGYPHRRRLDSDRSNDSRESADLSPDRCTSETELRIVASLNKLSLPDWYRSSIRKSRESLSILQQNNRSRKGSWSEQSDPNESRPESRTLPSTTPRPVVIRHRVSTFVRASPPKDSGIPQDSFELPSTKLRDASPVKLKRMEIKPIETVPPPMSRNEPTRESAREQYLRLRARSRSSSLSS